MISRRRFLEVGGVAAGVAAVSHPLLASVGTDKSDDPSLPPSLAQLKSRKGEAVPITREERLDRQERARQLMAENALDAIVLMEGTSLRYFTGIRWWGGERMFARCCRRKVQPFMCARPLRKGARENRSPTPPMAGSPTFAPGRKTKAPTSAWHKD